MFICVDKRLFAPCISTPKDKHYVFFLLGNQLDYAVRKPSPTAFGVGVRLMLTDGKGSVQQKDSFLCPFGKRTVFGGVVTKVGFQFLEDIFKGRGLGGSFLYGKA
jgi:hypothetical protein